MADSTEGDTDAQYLGRLVLALIGLMPGLVIHSFIVGVNVTDWWKRRSVTPVDHIVTSLGISRMCIQCANAVHFFFHPLSWRSQHASVTLILGISYDFLIYVSIWLTSLLSIVFCLKISNFHTRLFLYLKGMIVHRMVYFIVASVLLSAMNSLITLLLGITKVFNNGTYNKTMSNLTYCTIIDSVYPVTIGAIFPLFFYCFSSVLLFTSLYHHITKMKMSSNLSISLETYYSMMKFVAFNSIYNTAYLIYYFFCIFYYYVYCVSLDWFLVILGFLPVLHSSYLIYRTAKLRSRMSKVFQNVTDFIFQRKATETKENIEIVAL
ncbi:hypothetical protein GDO78_016424 [Eleutherodactylus coqui]|uniref:Taste receptor type 2 n=1 Tax=Eleutherodactylus coqui TaxID=57060 RepID=A0A8J6ECU4_ELECQ|nr:hypothetical protein GDO78_016424 [Eleutherodactylus coqui]